MEVMIWLSRDKRWINYDSNNLNIPEDASYLTIKDLPLELIETIKEATMEEVDNLLFNYI